ncbi:MAG: hypothetical protein LC672_00605 [Acidobacteria bacterium]|nr:hypothetical protein [Acidobacteriota bacterium]
MVMRAFLLAPLFITMVWQSPGGQVTTESSSVVVLGFKWSRDRQKVTPPDPASNAPARPAEKNFERNVRANATAEVRDPYVDTIEGRSAALEKTAQDAHAPRPKFVEGFDYRIKVQNAGKKVVEIVFWEYQFRDRSDLANAVTRQFLCGVQIKPDKEKELKAFSASGPGNRISAGSLDNKSENPFEERVLINRVEYADGTIWQRRDWNYAGVRSSIARALATPWGLEMCRNL